MRAGLCVLMALGCQSAAPADALTWTERWELLGVTSDGAVLDARVTVGNTGVLRGQGRVEVDWWPREGAPVRYARWSAPQATQREPSGESVVLDTDRLSGTSVPVGNWHLRARSDESNAVVQVQGRSGPLAPVGGAVEPGQWSVGAPVPNGIIHGWVESGESGGKLDGRGVVLHRGGDGRPGAIRRAAFLFSDTLAIGVDEQGPVRLAWGLDGGAPLDTRNARIEVQNGDVVIDFRPAVDLWVRFEALSTGGDTPHGQHLSGIEQWLLRLVSPRPARRVRAASAIVERGGVAESPRIGLLVWSAPESFAQPTPVVAAPAGRRGGAGPRKP